MVEIHFSQRYLMTLSLLVTFIYLVWWVMPHVTHMGVKGHLIKVGFFSHVNSKDGIQVLSLCGNHLYLLCHSSIRKNLSSK